MLAKLIRIYTPFICVIVALIHGVCYLLNFDIKVLYILGEFTGHSILLILYVICTCKKFCIWYKITNYMLLCTHIINLFYYISLFDYNAVFYTTMLFNLLAFISFIIYRVSVGITKILC